MRHISHPTPHIPDHELIRRIGEGSYGEIWLAKNILGTYRAVKIIFRANFKEARPYAREFAGIQKFEPISRTHPGLVDILQIGRNDEAGYFYYVMELADGETVGLVFNPATYAPRTLSRELFVRGRLSAMESIAIGRNLAAALAHMHSHGLIHRDIKPSNIIFVNGEPKLADIGLVVALTDARSLVGTEGYIPPEGSGTIHADLFGLGKVLYEMSTGLDRTCFPELPANLEEFSDARLVVELNEVVVKACANSSGPRYATAAELGADLEMLLAGGSVKHLRFVERQLKRAKRVAIATTVIALAAVVAGSVLNQMRRRQKELLAHSYLASAARLVKDRDFHGSLPFLAEAARLLVHDEPAMETHRARVGSVLQQSPQLLQVFQIDGSVGDLHFSPDNERLLIAGGNHARIIEIETGAISSTIQTEHSIETAAYSRDGARVVLAHGDLITVADLAAKTNVSFQMPAKVFSAEFSLDGETILIGCENSSAYLIDARNGESRGSAFGGHGDSVLYATFSPDASLVLTASQDGTAAIWDAASRRRLRVLPHSSRGWVHGVAFSPDGRRVVTGGSDYAVRLWEVSDEGSLPISSMKHEAEVRRVHFSPDGRLVVSVAWDHTVRFWDARTGERVGATLKLHTASMAAAFDPDARRIATAGAAGEVKIFQLASEAPRDVGTGFVSGDRERYITFTSNTFRVWSTRNDAPLSPVLRVPDRIQAGVCDWAGTRVLVQSRGETSESKLVHVFDTDSARSNSFVIPSSQKRKWWLSRDGEKLITTADTNFYLWNVTDRKMIAGPVDRKMAIGTAAFSPDASILALSGEKSDQVFLLDATTGAELRSPLQLGQTIRTLVFAPDSNHLLTSVQTDGFDPSAAQLWNARTGERLGLPMRHADGVKDAQFSADGTLICTVGEDKRAAIWDAKSGAPISDPIPLLWPPRSAAFNASKRWLVTATWHDAQVWDVRTGHPVTAPFTHPPMFERAGFCPGDRRIWVQSANSLLFWELPRDDTAPDQLMALADQLGVTVPSTLTWNSNALTTAQLQKRFATERERARARLDSWPREQARLSELKKDWFAAQFHLERLLKKFPDDAGLRRRHEQAVQQLEASTPLEKLGSRDNP